LRKSNSTPSLRVSLIFGLLISFNPQRHRTSFDGRNRVLEILDTAEDPDVRSEEFSTELVLRDCDGFFIVFDLTDRKSVEAASRGIQKVIKAKRSKYPTIKPEEIAFVILGNKSDLVDHRQVSSADGETLAKFGTLDPNTTLILNAPYFEVSAKERINVEEAFKKLMNEADNKFLIKNFDNYEYKSYKH
jgi:GTPase SAR1 family protein